MKLYAYEADTNKENTILDFFFITYINCEIHNLNKEITVEAIRRLFSLQ